MIKEVVPAELEVSEYNERQAGLETDSQNWSDFVKNIEENGIIHPPVVRVLEGGGYEVVIGQRRVEAAREAKLDKIEVVVTDWNNGDALQRSISENIGEFNERVSVYDRALALRHLAEEKYDGEGMPPQKWFSERLGVSQPTISRWLEPLSDEWEDTVISPLSQDGDSIQVNTLRELGVRKLRSIRKATNGGEKGEWLALKTVEEGLNINDLAQIREYVNKGASVEDAYNVVSGEMSFEDLAIEPEPPDDEETLVDEPETEEPEEVAEEGLEEPPLVGEGTPEEDGEDSEEKPWWEDKYGSKEDGEWNEGSWIYSLEDPPEEHFDNLDDEDSEETETEEDRSDEAVDWEWDDYIDEETLMELLNDREWKVPFEEACEDFHMTGEEMLVNMMEKYLREGHYI